MALRVRQRVYAPRPNHWVYGPGGRERLQRLCAVARQQRDENRAARKAAQQAVHDERWQRFRLALVALAEQFPEHRAELLRVFG